MANFLKQIGFGKSEFIPISGLTGAGVNISASSDASWYKGKSLIELMETIDVPDRTALRHRPLRATVNEYGEDNKGIVLRIRVECGKVGIGTKIRVCPTMKEAVITDILEPKVQAITVPDIAEVRVDGVEIDEVSPINMISRKMVISLVTAIGGSGRLFSNPLKL